ncbi:hypothetical protein MAH1_31590 [Sessilibacter sp. MAH1]
MLPIISKRFLSSIRSWFDAGFYKKFGVYRILVKKEGILLSKFSYGEKVGWFVKNDFFGFDNAALQDNLLVDEVSSVSSLDISNYSWSERIPSLLLSQLNKVVPVFIVFPMSEVRVTVIENSALIKKDKSYLKWLVGKSICSEDSFELRLDSNDICTIATGYQKSIIQSICSKFSNVSLEAIFPEFRIYEKSHISKEKIIVFVDYNSVSIVCYDLQGQVCFHRVIRAILVDYNLISSVYLSCCTVYEYFCTSLNEGNVLYKTSSDYVDEGILQEFPWRKIDDLYAEQNEYNLSFEDSYFIGTVLGKVPNL